MPDNNPYSRAGAAIGTAIGGGPGIGTAIGSAIGSVAGSFLGRSRARRARAAQRRANAAARVEIQQGLSVAQGIYNEARRGFQPAVEAGGVAARTLTSFFQGGREGLQKFNLATGYDFRRSEAIQAVEQSAVNRGQLFSGQAGVDIAARASELASAQTSTFLEHLRATTGVGVNASNGLANAGSTYTQAASNAARSLADLHLGKGNVNAQYQQTRFAQDSRLVDGLAQALKAYNDTPVAAAA